MVSHPLRDSKSPVDLRARSSLRKKLKKAYRASQDRRFSRVSMHPKNDPKSARLCCLQSSGLCSNLGSKHHRRNKKCWLYPQTCEHCEAVRIDSGQDEEEPSLSKPTDSLSSRKESMPNVAGLFIENQAENEQSVQVNNTLPLVRTSTTKSEPDAHRHDFETSFILGIPEIDQSHDGHDSSTDLVGFAIGEAMDSATSSASPIFVETTFADHILDSEDLIDDLEQRMFRSRAPSPDCYRDRARRSRIPMLAFHTREERREECAEARKRDPRLDLGFILAERP